MITAEAYNVDTIDGFKSQRRALLDQWVDVQNADALMIRDGGQEAWDTLNSLSCFKPSAERLTRHV